MTHYTIARIDVTDPSWVGEYLKHVRPLVEAAGGRYLTRTTNVEQVEGDDAPPQVALLLEWPSRESAMAFYESAEYRPYREARLAGTRSDMLLVPAEDVAERA